MEKISGYKFINKIPAFTLAETIMTLVIISLVVTAAIPVFTIRQNDLSGNVVNNAFNEPWHYCDDNEKRGLCTDKDILLGTNQAYTYNKNDSQAPHNANMSLQTTQANASIFDIIKSDKRWFKVGTHHILEEEHNNLFITPTLPTNFGVRNILVGSNNTNNGNDKITIGNNNDVSGNNTIVIGNNNSNVGANSIVVGSSNGNNDANGAIGAIGTNSIVVGSNISSVGDGAIAIGQNASGALANTLNIDGQIIADNTNLTLKGNLNINDGKTFVTSAPQTINSDKKLKNIKGSYDKGLKEILQIEPVNFYYKNSNKYDIHTGVIAQDIQKIFPEAVIMMPSGYYAVNNDPIFFAMLNSLKEIDKTTSIEEKKQVQMKKELEDLKAEIETLSECDSGFSCMMKSFFFDIKNFFKSIFSEVKYEKV